KLPPSVEQNPEPLFWNEPADKERVRSWTYCRMDLAADKIRLYDQPRRGETSLKELISGEARERDKKIDPLAIGLGEPMGGKGSRGYESLQIAIPVAFVCNRR